MANDGLYVGTGNGYETALKTKVSKIGILTEFVQTESSPKEFRYAYVKAYPERLLTVLKTEAYIGGNEKTLVVHMSDEFDESSANSASVTVTRNDGVVIKNIIISPDSAARTLTLTFPDGLRKGAYTLKTEGLVGSNDLIGYPQTTGFAVDKANSVEYYETKNYAVTDAEGNPVSGSDITGLAGLCVSVEVDSDEGNAFTLALVIYDKNNRVATVVAERAAVPAGETSVTLSAETPAEINVGAGCRVEQFVWLDDPDAGAVFVNELEALQAVSAQ